MKLGFIVNPIAGMGGKVGLKGTDGPEILKKALQLGSKPEAAYKSKLAIEQLLDLKSKLLIYTYPGDMGENIVGELGFEFIILRGKLEDFSAQDTEDAAKKMLEEGVDLILFAGGDGTARNIYNAIGISIPVIGIPAGVKIHSGVFANHPRGAGEIAYKFLNSSEKGTVDAEVMDIDEDAFRKGIVAAKLYGYLKIPMEEQAMQVSKSGGIGSEEDALEGIANDIVEDMEEGTYYIMGSGSSIGAIMDKLNLQNTLLGIDIVKDKEVIALDVNEKQILAIVSEQRAKIIVTVIGGQGYIFGRGNQQISSEVIKAVGKENIRVVASKNKLLSLEGRPLLVDTGNVEVNSMFNGYIKVLTSYHTETIERVEGL